MSTERTARNVLLGFVAVIASALPLAANADSSVTINSVVQRWPWNNKVDINYTVTGGQTRSSGVYCGLRFAVTANGMTHNFEGYTVGASAENGTHTITWTAPEGIISENCTMTATLFTTNVPSGNDYMIVDLNTGAVWYEGLFATQDESNARYNTDAYKGTNSAEECRLVLRKVPKWADKDTLPNAAVLAAMNGYPTGDAVNYPTSWNSPANWATDRDFYIGVFHVTQSQYFKLCGPHPIWYDRPERTNKFRPHLPVECVSWLDLRSPYGDNATYFAPTSSIPEVASDTGNFFQRLNYKTGLYFDMPTEVMQEIAVRAGATTVYHWGSTTNELPNYSVCRENSTWNGTYIAAEVGTRLPNDWGFYDMEGNVTTWCLDDATVSGNIATTRVDAFTPACSESGAKRVYKGGSFSYTMENYMFYASARLVGSSATYRGNAVSFRVAYIAE